MEASLNTTQANKKKKKIFQRMKLEKIADVIY